MAGSDLSARLITKLDLWRHRSPSGLIDRPCKRPNDELGQGVSCAPWPVRFRLPVSEAEVLPQVRFWGERRLRDGLFKGSWGGRFPLTEAGPSASSGGEPQTSL